MKKKLKLKKFVLPMVYSIFVIATVISVYYISNRKEEPDEITYVSSSILNNDIPVVNTEVLIKKPYLSEKVTIGKTFYDYQADEETQKKAIVTHENTYMQNSGVDYISDESFDIVAILDGEVISVTEEELLGKVIEIRHENDIISTYQSLSETSIKKGNHVTQGQVIGKSGTSEINKEYKNCLHFELYINASIVNPETHYEKNIKEFKN